MVGIGGGAELSDMWCFDFRRVNMLGSMVSG
jgi:hypothetical protein